MYDDFCLTTGRVCERMRVYCFCVSVTWLARVPVLLCASVCVGLLRGCFLAVQWPCDVRVRASSQYPVLQEEIFGVSQVCGVTLSPRC